MVLPGEANRWIHAGHGIRATNLSQLPGATVRSHASPAWFRRGSVTIVLILATALALVCVALVLELMRASYDEYATPDCVRRGSVSRGVDADGRPASDS